jgi:hypothetical protein
MFPYCNIHRYNWTSTVKKTHRLIMSWQIKDTHSNIGDVWSFSRADCDTNHYLVVAKVRVSKWAALKFHVERFNLRKLNDVQVKGQCQAEISNGCAALENLMMMTMTMKMWASVGIGNVLEYKSFSHRV